MKKFFAAASVFAIFFIFSGLFLGASSNFSSKNTNKEPVVLEKPLDVITVGERFTFEVFWMGIPVGLGTLEVKEKVKKYGRDAYHVIAVARTNDFLSKLYPIYDEVHSYIDAERFCSLEFEKNVREGRYRANEKVVYDYEKRVGVYESLLNHSKKEIEIPGLVHDAVSAFYWFRLQNVGVGKSLRTVVNSREKNWDLEIQVLSSHRKELRGRGVFPTILVEPKTLYRDVLYDRGRAWVYFTTDKQRVPLWVTIKTPFGPVHGVLKTE